MKEIYRKTSIFSFVGGGLVALFAIAYYFIWYKGISINGDNLFEFLLIAFSLLCTGFYFNHAQKKLGNETISDTNSELQIETINELIIQEVPSIFPKMYNVDADGKPLFQIATSKRRPYRRKLTVIKLFSGGFLIPATYDILDMKKELLAFFTIWNNGNRFVLTLYNVDGKRIGYFEQRLTKSVLKNKGTLFHDDGTIWRELTANNMAGDIDIRDEDERISATYRYGRFPYALNPAFQAEALHSYIRFGSHISENEKLAYTMIFFYWLKN